MFLLPAILLPFLFGLAVYRLVQIPHRLWSGTLQVPARRRAAWCMAGGTAYLVVLGYTLGLGAAVVHALVFAADPIAAWLSLVGYVLAYPVAYVVAAWVLYHALQSVPPRSGRGLPRGTAGR